MSDDFWPHQFAPFGDPVKIGERHMFDDDTSQMIDVTSRKMRCVHCKITYVQNKDARPPDPCPARNEKREFKRIFNKSGGKPPKPPKEKK